MPMSEKHSRPWVSTTHDWSGSVDHEHLKQVRDGAATFAPTGTLHLVLEVLAYAADEAGSLGERGRCLVTLHEDGSILVADDGRGTDTRRDLAGEPVRKPVMSTKDLRFFDSRQPPHLPDGAPRRGMSVVAALSTWLVHENHRHDGAWNRRYELGVPVTDLREIPFRGATGTVVRFRPSPEVRCTHDVAALRALAGHHLPRLAVDVVDRR